MLSRHVPLLALLPTVLASCSGGGAAPDSSGGDDTDGAADGGAELQGDTQDSGGSGDAGDAGRPDATEDPDGSGDDADASEVDTADTADTPEPPPAYVREYLEASSMPAPAGWVWRRAIVHLHSTHSHDACDGTPRLEDDAYNLPCLADLRAALCTTRIDFAFLTDHRDLMAWTPWLDLLLHDPATDRLVRIGEDTVANEIICEGGHVVTTAPGMETSLMPVSFPRPMDGEDAEHNAELLHGDDRATVDRFRGAGALAWTAHTEGKTIEELDALDLDGIEIYNLHANLDPDIREVLGLDGFAVFRDIVPFVMQRIRTSPDLSLLVFLTENPPSLRAWAHLLQAGPVVGTAGTDAHQNVLAEPLVDGERYDSYRRMLAWFSNYLLATDTDFLSARDALAAGRNFVAFDTLASPAGFDVALFSGGARIAEMGSTTPLSDGLSLRARIPQPEAGAADAPTVRAILYRAGDGDWTQVAESGAGDVEWEVTEPGPYRVEVRITPSHLAKYMETLGRYAEVEFPWIYSNAFRITAGG